MHTKHSGAFKRCANARLCYNQKQFIFNENKREKETTTSHVIMSLNGAKIMSTYVFHRVCGSGCVCVCEREPQAVPLIFICRLKSFPSFCELYILYGKNNNKQKYRIKSADTEIKQANTLFSTRRIVLLSYIYILRTEGIHVAVIVLSFSLHLFCLLCLFSFASWTLCVHINKI